MKEENTFRGVILAGGYGTRMNPATKTTNKHLLPTYTSDGALPMIEYPINTLIKMGCGEILIITSRDHCGKIVEYLGDGYDRGVCFTYKIQEMNDPKRPPGIASALKLCKDFTRDDPFAVILGDNYFSNNVNINNSLYDFYTNHDIKCCVFVSLTEEWERFGIARLDDNDEKVLEIVEKPKEYISSWAVTGLYIYEKDVYDVADTLKPSTRGELEITDINNYYVRQSLAKAITLTSFWSDMGTPESMNKTLEFLNLNNV